MILPAGIWTQQIFFTADKYDLVMISSKSPSDNCQAERKMRMAYLPFSMSSSVSVFFLKKLTKLMIVSSMKTSKWNVSTSQLSGSALHDSISCLNKEVSSSKPSENNERLPEDVDANKLRLVVTFLVVAFVDIAKVVEVIGAPLFLKNYLLVQARNQRFIVVCPGELVETD